VRRCGGKRDRYSATATPTSVDSVAATSVSAALPPSAERIAAVVLGGRLLRRPELDALLREGSELAERN